MHIKAKCCQKPTCFNQSYCGSLKCYKVRHCSVFLSQLQFLLLVSLFNLLFWKQRQNNRCSSKKKKIAYRQTEQNNQDEHILNKQPPVICSPPWFLCNTRTVWFVALWPWCPTGGTGTASGGPGCTSAAPRNTCAHPSSRGELLIKTPNSSQAAARGKGL